MALSQIALPSWIGPGEPAGAPMLRGAQAGATIARSFTDASRIRQEQKQFDELRPVREAQARASVANAYMVERRNYDQAEGDVDYGKWYAQYGHDPVAMMNAPLPQNEYAAQRAAAAKVSASQTDVAKKYASDITEFNKRLGGLDADLRSQFFGQIKAAPTKEQWDLLGESETAQRKRDFEKKQLESELEQQRNLEKIGAIGKSKIDVAEVNAEARVDSVLSSLERKLADAEAKLAGYQKMFEGTGGKDKIINSGPYAGFRLSDVINRTEAEISTLRQQVSTRKSGESTVSGNNNDPLGLFSK